MHIPRTIYAIRHNETGRVYVGSSATPAKRIRSHLNALRRGKHNNSAMQSDFDLYGDDYSAFYLGEITRFEDRYLEYVWMSAMNSRDPAYGYNGKEHTFAPSLDRSKKVLDSTDGVTIWLLSKE